MGISCHRHLEARSNHTGVGVGRQMKRAQRSPHPLPCQVSRFVLASSSLCILSVRLTIEKKEEEMEQSKTNSLILYESMI